jgi:hypothetical protein
LTFDFISTKPTLLNRARLIDSDPKSKEYEDLKKCGENVTDELLYYSCNKSFKETI